MEEAADRGERYRLVVEEAPAEARLDAYLARRLPELSRSRVAQLLESGRVRVNGRVPRKSERPTPGMVIEVELPPAEAPGVRAEPIPLEIVYEDGDLVVVNKPAGLVVHPAPGHATGTLVNALLYHIRDLSGIGGVLRPGILHRLDKDTSGLLVVAKNDEAHRRLAAALKRREVKRVYLAAAWGHLPQDELTVEAPIGRSPTHRQRMAVVAGGGRRSRTCGDWSGGWRRTWCVRSWRRAERTRSGCIWRTSDTRSWAIRRTGRGRSGG